MQEELGKVTAWVVKYKFNNAIEHFLSKTASSSGPISLEYLKDSLNVVCRTRSTYVSKWPRDSKIWRIKRIPIVGFNVE